uniref:Uncharacterized protein n=1 Tax=Anguilla anguilla TaxID=7936 RepID=A0A0E9U2W8_ANGAN
MAVPVLLPIGAVCLHATCCWFLLSDGNSKEHIAN